MPKLRGLRGCKGDINAPLYIMLRDAERRILREVLEYHDFNETAAAKQLGVSHTLVWKRVRMLGGIRPGDPRREPYDHQEAEQVLKGGIRGEKHRNSDPSTGQLRTGSDSPTDAADGAAGSPDDAQDGDGDHVDVAG